MIWKFFSINNDKIKKLLALSESGNQHEAQNALAKAQMLMMKHKISFVEVEINIKVLYLFKSKELLMLSIGFNKMKWIMSVKYKKEGLFKMSAVEVYKTR